MVEQWFVVPKVLGSNPRLHPHTPHTTPPHTTIIKDDGGEVV